MRAAVDYELFPHDADIGVRGCGADAVAAFEAAARALTAIVTDPATVRAGGEAIEVRCEAPDLELLLVEWLNRVIYEMVTRNLLFAEVHVTLVPLAAGTRLEARLRGEPLDRERHAPTVEIKGATYTALRVAQQDGRWCAQCVVDV